MEQQYIDCTKKPWVTEPKTDTQWRVDEYDDHIVINFQYSKSKMDWLQNFDILIKPFKRMRHLFFVHRGLFCKWESVKEPIMDRVVSAMANDKEIRIQAYSQGGGIGLDCHEEIYFKYNGYQSKTIVFGNPMVFSVFGWRHLKKVFTGVTLVFNGNDWVTKLAGILFGYRHYGNIVYMGNKRRWWKISIKDHMTYRENLND